MDMSDGSPRASNSVIGSLNEAETEIYERPNEIEVDLTGDDEIGNEGPSVGSQGLAVSEAVVLKPRAYQIEMLEESLRRNTIVVMETGSGKTHIAVLRILAELERIGTDQFIWFLAPTVSLGSQQYEYIKSQISAVQIKFLCGGDGVDRWTDQSLWNGVLKNIKVVVSTYQVLLDALTHGFVRMQSLALIVFDEAHNCVGNQAGTKIMQSFYHTQKSEHLQVPHILGLTASPVMRSDPLSLSKIESTLNAICRTPKIHREELRLQVKLPVLSQIYYHSLPPLLTGYTRTIQSLGNAFKNLNIEEDPYIISLLDDNTERSLKRLEKARLTHKTWCQEQMKSFHAMSLKICGELGAWAADYYISEVRARFIKMADEDNNYLGKWDVTSTEKRYLANVLRKVEITRTASDSPAGIPLVSDKVAKLIEAMLQESSTFVGLVFVQERAMVSVLSHLLSVHPDTRTRCKIGTMVGVSSHSYRSQKIGDLLDMDAQKDTLSLFKAGELNLVIATSVLEEGVDVPACNLVICFQKPVNLKSFVQRRGRARQRDSKLILLLDSNGDRAIDWQQLEQDMKDMYEDEMRSLEEFLVIEDREEHDSRQFRVESTRAVLDLDNAMAHLHHFCGTLTSKDFVDLRPDFIFEEVGDSFIQARVILPLQVAEKVRVARSRKIWRSEKNAKKDAAFEAYVSLYQAGLINENLLPLLLHDEVTDELQSGTVETRASIILVNEQINPWIDVAKAWRATGNRTIDGNDVCARGVRQSLLMVEGLKVKMYAPVEIPEIPPFRMYWDAKTEMTVTHIVNSPSETSETLISATRETWSVLTSAFGYRFPIERKQSVVLFAIDEEKSLQAQIEPREIFDSTQLSVDVSQMRLIRDKTNSRAYIYKAWLMSKPPFEAVQHPYPDYGNTPEDIAHLSLTPLPRRLDFLHKIPRNEGAPSKKPFSFVLPISRCTVDSFPFRYVQFGRMIPCILHRFEVYLLADKLSKTILKDVRFTDLSLVVTAISASGANEESNYQRLEFLGDSVLKLCTSVQLMDKYPLWHEGYLSAKRDRFVANSRLARAALEVGLDKYIISKPFSGHKWQPMYVDDLLEASIDARRNLSSKVVADVVEALIGAAMVDGGVEKALACLKVFLPELDWLPLSIRRHSLYQCAPEFGLPKMLQPLETLIGYTFVKKALLVEAMTHASYNSGSQSLDRLEFLGDAVLDNIIVTAVYRQQAQLSHVKMHLLRTALVNADFLAFLCMEWGVQQEHVDIVETKTPKQYGRAGNGTGAHNCKAVPSMVTLWLWMFMRHMSPKLGAVQVMTAKRHAKVRDEINAAIESGSHYPWALLARLKARKFYSDIVESLLGAVWIDSGSFDKCSDLLERIGMLPYLRRILRDKVHIWHPKEEIGKLADTEAVKYVVSKSRGNVGVDIEEAEYSCRVFVGDVEIVEMSGGISKDEIKTKAAELAVNILKARKEDGGSSAEAMVTDDIGKDGEQSVAAVGVMEVEVDDIEMSRDRSNEDTN